MSRVVHFEIQADDLAQAREFYGAVFGWQFQDWGGVTGTLVGTLIVTVLQNGLTHAGIDSLYQQVATGVLVVLAVAVDRLTRTRQSR